MNAPIRTAPDDHALVPVWDLPVRLVHWAIVLLLAVMVPTGLAGDDWLAWHMRAGQTLLILVAFRLLWGFFGSGNARFRRFLRGPGAVVRYARSLVRPPHDVHATHNPLGGWMVVLLLVALVVQATTGLFTNDDVLWEGPLAQRVTKETSDALSSIHRRFWWLLLALAAVHVVAAIGYLVAFRENLIHAMFTGRKRLPPSVARPEDAAASHVRAVLLLAVVIAAFGWFVYRG
jgi:cytochrome b